MQLPAEAHDTENRYEDGLVAASAGKPAFVPVAHEPLVSVNGTAVAPSEPLYSVPTAAQFPDDPQEMWESTGYAERAIAVAGGPATMISRRIKPTVARWWAPGRDMANQRARNRETYACASDAQVLERG